MRWFLLVSLLFAKFQYSFGQDFGQFASAVFIQNCTNSIFYNTTGDGANCINNDCAVVFNGLNFGSFYRGSSALALKGGEIKTWKNGSGNVCSARINYTIYPDGSRPGSPVFEVVNLPFKAWCDAGTFSDGFGPCGGNDQKWSEENLAPVDLTNRDPGVYRIELYYDYTGANGSTSDCNATQYISNGGSNYIALFTILDPSAPSGDCSINPLPINLFKFSATCKGLKNEIHWSTGSESSTSHFTIEKSSNGNTWSEIGKVEAVGNSNQTQHYSFYDKNIEEDFFYRLKQTDLNGQNSYSNVIKATCGLDKPFVSTFPNPSNNNFSIQINHLKRETSLTILVNDIKGALIYTSDVFLSNGNHLVPVNKKLASGVYFISVFGIEDNTIEVLKHLVN
jgi:hypothetical protein